jgi:hypothetical protein
MSSISFAIALVILKKYGFDVDDLSVVIVMCILVDVLLFGMLISFLFDAA